MRVFSYLISFCLFIAACSNSSDETTADEEVGETMAKYAMVIHGGAGTILKSKMTAEREKAYLDALNETLSIGEEILSKGGSATDAVIAAVEYMENSTLFNAGKGAVFTNDGKNELDASIMDGSTMNAGAIGGVTTIKNPIKAARAVLEQSEHVFLIGKGAEQFASAQGIEMVDPKYFYTERRWQSLQNAKEREVVELDHDEKKMGTVGAVALDQNGNIVAGTSTGGMTNKRYGRLGDVPVIGAGTYANNKTCGVSCTGHGEYFIRYAVAHDVSAMMEYKNISLEEATNEVVNKKLVEAGGSGGLIALDAKGNVSMTFNSEGMYRGYVRDGQREVAIYKD